MKRLLCFAIVTVGLVLGSLVFSPRASAITYGFIDSTNTFSNAGAFIVKDTATGEIFPICSGTMITSKVFLTAGHCTAYFAEELAPQGFVAYVSLDSSIPFGALTSGNTNLLWAAHGVPFFQDINPVPRMFSFSSFNALNGGYLRLSQNPSTGNGGTCFGDSGGPNFFTVDNQQLLVSIPITGDSVCRATNTVYRLDIPTAQSFFATVNDAFGTSIPVSSC